MTEPTGSTVPPRSTRRRWVLVAIVVAVFAVAVGGGFGALTVLRGRSASAQLDQATKLIEEADVIVVSIDKVVGSQVTSELAQPAQEARASVTPASALLNEAVATIDRAAPQLGGATAERATLLRAAAEARLAMLLQAPTILDTNLKAASALPVATEAWEHVVEADRLSDQAVVGYNKLTGKGVKESRRLNAVAAKELAAARDGFTTAQQSFPEAGFEAYLAYIAMRLELNALSKRSDEAWLSGQLEQANAAISTYNDLDAKAVAAAKLLPASPAKAVASAYSAIAAAATDEYYAARTQATDADARLRNR